jgi:hypothetical protein
MKTLKNTKLFSFLRLSFKQKTMFFANFFLCGIARAAIKFLPFSYLTPYFGTFGKTITLSQLISSQQLQQAVQIRKSITLAAKYTPWESNCLTQALVAKFWCSLYKLPYAFYIGFAKSKESASGFKGHAWVTTGPIAITGGHSFSEYQVISSYFSR